MSTHQQVKPATTAISHPGETASNAIRARVSDVEPRCLRTYTPSAAVIARSAGSYHWTPEGRKLADFSSGVLVANLGHNPVRWWNRLREYLGIAYLPDQGDFHPAFPLSAYNAITELDALASERIVASLRSQTGGTRM